jgi:hypothetical protein
MVRRSRATPSCGCSARAPWARSTDLAQHPRLPRRDALKVLPAAVSADSEYRERFNREADIAATLWHPHIVGMHDRGDFEGQLWISMDYVDGTDAGRLLRKRFSQRDATTADGASAYCSTLQTTGTTIWSLNTGDVPSPTVTAAPTEQPLPIEEESPVRVCMQQTGRTRLACREMIRRSNLGLP